MVWCRRLLNIDHPVSLRKCDEGERDPLRDLHSDPEFLKPLLSQLSLIWVALSYFSLSSSPESQNRDARKPVSLMLREGQSRSRCKISLPWTTGKTVDPLNSRDIYQEITLTKNPQMRQFLLAARNAKTTPRAQHPQSLMNSSETGGSVFSLHSTREGPGAVTSILIFY